MLEKPFGRDATTVALLNAADTLFGEKGPNAVTIREIAALANVNHALVHRHFGSKEALLDALIEKHLQASKNIIASASSPNDSIKSLLNYLATQPSFSRTFAHLILDKRPLEDFVRKAGGTSALALLLEQANIESSEARATAAILVAFMLGWTLFKDLTSYAASSQESDDQLNQRAITMLSNIFSSLIEKGSQTKTC